MKTRPFGNTGKFVSEIGFGAWQLGNDADWGHMDDNEAIRLVNEALERGINFFDTAPNYAFGRSEELLGKALKGKRDQVVISTKFGHHSDGGRDFSPAKVRASVENSLRRLQTDYIDSLLLHNPPLEALNGKSPHYEILEALQREGKIGAYGASVDSSKEVIELAETTKSGIAEVMFNIFFQEPAAAFALAQRKNMGVIIKVPLDSGWLSGKYNGASSFDKIRSRWSVEAIRKRAELLEKIKFITDEGASMAQAALRFILAFPEVSTVIPGARNLEQLKENIAASDGVMGEELVKRLRELWEREVRGCELGW